MEYDGGCKGKWAKQGDRIELCRELVPRLKSLNAQEGERVCHL